MPLSFATDASGTAPSWRQEATLAAVVAAGFALYLFTSEYHNLYYDAEDYWQLGHRFYQNGQFKLLAYDDAMRGYSYPLVNFLCLAVRKALNCPAVTVVKLLNAVLAGLLFGVVGPRLWQASTGAATASSAALENAASEPPFSRQALPVFRHSAKLSMVTFGWAS